MTRTLAPPFAPFRDHGHQLRLRRPFAVVMNVHEIVGKRAEQLFRDIATFPREEVTVEVYAVQNEGGMAIHFLAKWRALEFLNRLRRPAALVVKPGNLMIDHRLAVEFFPVRTPAVYRLVIAALPFEHESAPEVGRHALLVIGVNEGAVQEIVACFPIARP